ncbi:hypothetical protein KEM09_11880 [Carboxylicivirga mesophila]|uniref:Uncharacterized protein n=1 Tax=Carboxylicivirga mesophila TaxID=1166478 RepID=A0ABS5KC78_9BACT|nr:hypothetical protein [Carboxylicivirga mesophila]MBS2212108.1 hypothetical protein [Carboxylicivirga mesophila]
MRYLNVIAVVIVSFVICSCENNTNEPEVADFVFKAEKDNQTWLATRSWGYLNEKFDELSISATVEDPDYYQEEAMTIKINKASIEPDKKLMDFDASLAFIIGGDGVAWRYESIKGEQTYLIIHHVDEENKRVRGAFQIKFADSSSDGEPIIMTDGVFDVAYEHTNSY